ncbi:MAG: lamin tail domain-containing protein [Promethearchaeota archaeon]
MKRFNNSILYLSVFFLLISTTIFIVNSQSTDYSNLIISEIFYDSIGTDTSCFIEIYNVGSTTVDLDDINHDIIVEGVNGATGTVYVTIDLTGTVAAGSYYVVAQSGVDFTPDQTDEGANFQNGPDGVRLVDNITKTIIDALQYGDTGEVSTGCLEGFPAMDVLPGYSLSRNDLNTDTGDNSQDFYGTSIPTPGAVGIIPDVSLLKITEVLYDTVSIDTGCFIEIFNSGSAKINLNDDHHDIILEGVNGATGETYILIDLSGEVEGKDYYVLAQDDTVNNYDQIDPGADLQNGPDGVRLVDNTTRTVIDALQYGDTGGVSTGCLEGTPTMDVDSGYSLTRDDLNIDTNNNSEDFYQTITATPGEVSNIISDLSLVVSEVFYDSISSDSGCFVEIYNVGSTIINLDDSKKDIILEGVNGANGETYILIDLTGEIEGEDYYVLAQDDTVDNYDQIDPRVNLQNGPDGVRLVDNTTKTVIDALQYGDTGGVSTGCLEGTPAMDVLPGYSLSRNDLNTDTDDNSQDFYGTSIPTPGAVGIIPDVSLLKITEVLYDTVSIDTGCFIEIFSSGSAKINLNDDQHDIILEGVNGANEETYILIDLTGEIEGEDYYVLAQDDTVDNYDQIDPGANLQNGPDGVRLVDNTTKTVIDALQYGDTGGVSTGCLEGTPTLDVDSGYSLTRDVYNTDTNNNSADFSASDTPTPGSSPPPPPTSETTTDTTIDTTTTTSSTTTAAITTGTSMGTSSEDTEETSQNTPGIDFIIGFFTIFIVSMAYKRRCK